MISGNYYKGSTIEIRLQTGIILTGATVSIYAKKQDGTTFTIPGTVVDYTTIVGVLDAEDNAVAGQIQLQAKAVIPPTAANKTIGLGAVFFTNPVDRETGDPPRYYQITRAENPGIFNVTAYATEEDRAARDPAAWASVENSYAQTPGTVAGMGRPWDLNIALLTEADIPAEAGLNFDIVETTDTVLFGKAEQLMILEPFAEPGP